MAKTHGMRKTRVWGVWWQMIQRCRNPNVKAYPRYGGRGIKVCQRWQDFENFFADMGHPPLGLSLERKENDGDYEPTNCTWAMPLEQVENRRNTLMIEWCGLRKSASAWDKMLGYSKGTTRARLQKGWPLEHIMLPSAVVAMDEAACSCPCRQRPYRAGEGLCVECGLPPGNGMIAPTSSVAA